MAARASQPSVCALLGNAIDLRIGDRRGSLLRHSRLTAVRLASHTTDTYIYIRYLINEGDVAVAIRHRGKFLLSQRAVSRPLPNRIFARATRRPPEYPSVRSHEESAKSGARCARDARTLGCSSGRRDATRRDERLVARGWNAVPTRANFTRSLVAADRGILKNA